MGDFATATSGKASLARFHFDEIMRSVPANMKVNIGPGEFLTRGYGPHWAGGWQPKSGQKILGAGSDVTILKLMGAGVVKVGNDLVEQHYHAIGMPVVPAVGSTTAISPLKHFEVSNLTIDCNMDGQPFRGPTSTYAKVACGAVRILGSHCRIQNIKTINWGTRSLKESCFAISVIGASGTPSDASSQPIVNEGFSNGIVDCIAVQPCQNCSRETTVMHMAGVKNAGNHAQGFHCGSVIRHNFVDCGFRGADGRPIPGAFISSATSTIVGSTCTFVSIRPHNVSRDGGFFRFYQPRNSKSYWNGYFLAVPPKLNPADTSPNAPRDPYKLNVTVNLSVVGGENDSSFVIMGTEFRGMAMSSCDAGIVHGNQIHNCWIGGPYQNKLNDLAEGEAFDPLNWLNLLSLIVRDNFYRNVAVGPYWHMGGLTAAVTGNAISYNATTGIVTVTTTGTPHLKHHLWQNARVKIESAPVSAYESIHEITTVTDDTFQFQLAPGLSGVASGTASYRVVSGTDHLVIEGNQIWLADLDETEFAIKDYPLAATPAAQKYRPYGIIVADNELSPGYAHRQVFIRNNRISQVDTEIFPTPAGIGQPAGGGMLLAGIKQLHVTHNLVEVNARQPLRTYRCGMARYFNNKKLDGTIVPGGIAAGDGHYDEPETLMEDAFVLSLLLKRRRR